MEEETLLDKYQKEIVEDLKINELTIKDASLSLPSLKHKWASRLILEKIQLKKANNALKKAKDVLIDKERESSPVKVSTATILKKIDENESVLKIKEKIEDHSLMIEYLEKIEKILSSTSWDIKNIIDIIKLETT